MDMESNLDAVNREAFRLADQIVLVEKPGETANHKMKTFLEQAAVQEQKEKMLLIRNFAENGSAYLKGAELPVFGVVHHYGNLSLKNVIQTVNSSGEYDADQLLGRL